jgi:hypothetical protein
LIQNYEFLLTEKFFSFFVIKTLGLHGSEYGFSKNPTSVSEFHKIAQQKWTGHSKINTAAKNCRKEMVNF